MPLKATGIKFTEDQLRYIRQQQRREKLSTLSQTVKRMVELDRERNQKRWRRKGGKHGR